MKDYGKNQSYHARYDYLKSIGKCVRCGTSDAVPGMAQCADCLYKQSISYDAEKRHVKYRERYEARVENGVCISCNEKAVPGRKRCKKCLERAKYAARAWREEHAERKIGVCLAKGCWEQPVSGKCYCNKHLASAQNRIYPAIDALNTSSHPWRMDETARRKAAMKF